MMLKHTHCNVYVYRQLICNRLIINFFDRSHCHRSIHTQTVFVWWRHAHLIQRLVFVWSAHFSTITQGQSTTVNSWGLLWLNFYRPEAQHHYCVKSWPRQVNSLVSVNLNQLARWTIEWSRRIKKPSVETKGLIRKPGYEPLFYKGCITYHSVSTALGNAWSTATPTQARQHVRLSNAENRYLGGLTALFTWQTDSSCMTSDRVINGTVKPRVVHCYENVEQRWLRVSNKYNSSIQYNTSNTNAMIINDWNSLPILLW